MAQNLADAKKATILERFEYRATPVEVLFIFIPSPVKDRQTRKAKKPGGTEDLFKSIPQRNIEQ